MGGLDGESRLMICGGRQGATVLDDCQVLIPETNEWMKREKALLPRGTEGAGNVMTTKGTYVRKKGPPLSRRIDPWSVSGLFIAGGFDGHRPYFPHSRAEIFTSRGSFLPLSPMPSGLYEPCAAPLDPDRTMVVGGEVSSGESRRAFVHRAGADTWSEVEPMSEPRSMAMCGKLPNGGGVVVAGGWSGGRAVSSVEIFQDGKWRRGPDLPRAWCQGDMVVGGDGRPVIVGGLTQNAGGKLREERRLLKMGKGGGWVWMGERLEKGKADAAAVLAPGWVLHNCGERDDGGGGRGGGGGGGGRVQAVYTLLMVTLFASVNV